MKEVKFQYYPARVDTKKPIGFVYFEEFINSIKSPSDKTKQVFSSIAKAEKDGDMKLKAKLKQENLFYFTPCVWSNWKSRKYEDIESFTGLAVLDFDHIDNAEQFKQYIFNTYTFVACAFLSASKRGVKFLIKIPVVSSVNEYKSYFYGLGFLFDKFKGWDGSPQNAVLPLFLSYDPDLLYRENPDTFQERGKKLNAFQVESQTPVEEVEVRDGDSRLVYFNIKKAFDSIVDSGHPQVIAACVSLGGYVASGYVSQQEAEDWAFGFIQSNNYLQKGVKGYQKTARTAIQTGMRSQLKLKTNNQS